MLPAVFYHLLPPPKEKHLYNSETDPSSSQDEMHQQLQQMFLVGPFKSHALFKAGLSA